MKQETKLAIAASVRDFCLPRYNEIPNVGLYLEQTTKYICEYLAPLGEFSLTSSMISNYVKKGLIANPVKKQYSREQIAYLFFIAVAKMSADSTLSSETRESSKFGSQRLSGVAPFMKASVFTESRMIMKRSSIPRRSATTASATSSISVVAYGSGQS